MAVPSYATDLTDIVTSFTTGWSLVSEGGGGQNSLTAPETDDFIEGTQSVSRNPFSSSVRGMAYDKTTTVAVTTDDAVFYWWKADVAQALDTKASGGIRLTMGTSTTAYRQHYIAGKDTYALGGWKCDPIDPNDGGDLDRGSPGTPDYDWFGIVFDVPATGPSKGFPFKIDMIRHGRSVDVTAGDVANPASWDTLTVYADNTTRRWGIVQGTDTGAEQQGIVNWGTATTAVYSRDSNRAIVFKDTEFTVTDFTQLIFNHASTDLEWDGMSITALGTSNRGIITINNNAAVTITNSVIADIDTTADGGTNSVWDGTKWSGCNAITGAGGSFLGCSVLVPTVTANTSGFIYDETVDPDGELDDMVFSMGTNDHHAIEFGTNIPSEITLRGLDFTGFNASQDVNASTFHFKDTGGTITVNLVGCTSDVALSSSYRTDGATINIVEDPVTTKIVVKDADTNSFIQNARVLGWVTSGVNFPYQASVSITGSGTTATVTHTAHGLATGDTIWIEGTDQENYSGAYDITVTGVNTYTYTTAETVVTTPATGTTITATFCFFNDLTDANGEVSDNRVIGINQPFNYRVRKSTASPLYKQGTGSETSTSSGGISISVNLVSDE